MARQPFFLESTFIDQNNPKRQDNQAAPPGATVTTGSLRPTVPPTPRALRRPGSGPSGLLFFLESTFIDQNLNNPKRQTADPLWGSPKLDLFRLAGMPALSTPPGCAGDAPRGPPAIPPPTAPWPMDLRSCQCSGPSEKLPTRDPSAHRRRLPKLQSTLPARSSVARGAPTRRAVHV